VIENHKNMTMGNIAPGTKHKTQVLQTHSGFLLCKDRQIVMGHTEPAPTSAPSRMDDMWSGNSFLLGSSSLANHDG
jgi:hypothetical protein